MGFFELLSFALANIWAQKLRTFLTFSAISIGGLLVFVLPSLGLGVSREVKKSFESQEAVRTFDIAPKYEEFKFDDAFSGEYKAPKLLKKVEVKDIMDITAQAGVTGIREVGFTITPDRIFFDSLNKRVRTYNEQVPDYSQSGLSFSGGSVDLRTMYVPNRISSGDRNLEVTHGRFFESDDATKLNALVSEKVLEGLKVDKPAELIGKTVTLTFIKDLPTELTADIVTPEARKYTATIIGIVKSKSENDNAPYITIPFQQAWDIKQWQAASNKEFTDNFTFYSLTVVADDAAKAESLAQTYKDKGFSVTTAKDQLNLFTGIVKVLVAILSSFGIIALAVGALNVINTMFMAVTERTREIGILRALGASRSTILNLFLAESAMIALLGGLLGVLFGWLVSLGVNGYIQSRIVEANLTSLGIPTSVFDYSFTLILGVLGFIVLIGLLAGLVPAIRASRLKVVDSLRYE